MNKRQRVSSGAPWEDIVGYCRAVQVGDLIEVAGTTAVVDGQLIGKGDAYLQTQTIFKIIEGALKDLGATMEHVVRTRMYVTNIEDWQAIGKAHGEVFASIKPASTMVEVKGLVDPEMLVEIEVTAVL